MSAESVLILSELLPLSLIQPYSVEWNLLQYSAKYNEDQLLYSWVTATEVCRVN